MIPDNLQTRIQKEAEAAVKKIEHIRAFTNDQCYVKGYEVGATAVVSDPGAYGLAGSWVRASERLPNQEWYGPIRHCYDEKHKVWEYDSCSLRQMECNIENFPDVEWLSESPSPNPSVTESDEQREKDRLVGALEKIAEMKREAGETSDTYAFNRCWHIATEALKPYKK
jgi:hypothetical protein